MNRIGDVLATLKARRKNKKAARGSESRVNDLFEKFYHYDKKIAIPLPNLYAHTLIETEFKGMENIDFEKDEHIGKVLFILNNQDNDKPEYLTNEQKDVQIRDILRGIPLHAKEKYQQALYEMFIALKKNSNRRQKDILMQALEIIQN